MTLVEFLAPLRKTSHRDRVLAALYFKYKYENINKLTVEQIKQALKQARAPRWTKVNVPDVLVKSGHFVDSPGSEAGRRLWSLTRSGIGYIQELLGLPSVQLEIEHDIGSLSTIVGSILDDQVREYVAEAVKCLQVDALRAAVVFLWTGTIRAIHVQLLSAGSGPLNAALQKHDLKSHTVNKVDDFAYIKDKISLLAAQEVGILDKTQKDTLQEALDLRNRCGHPGKYRPGVKKVSSFIEDLVSIVFK